MESLILFLGAALGSAGLGGALAGVVQFSRAARTARLIEQIKKALDEGDGAGAGDQVFRLALDRERLRLASLSFVAAPRSLAPGYLIMGITTLLVVVVLSSGILPIVLTLNRDVPPTILATVNKMLNVATWVFVLFFIGYIAFVGFIFDSIIQRRRARFMVDAESPGADAPALIRELGILGQHPKKESSQPREDRKNGSRGGRRVVGLLALAIGSAITTTRSRRDSEA